MYMVKVIASSREINLSICTNTLLNLMWLLKGVNWIWFCISNKNGYFRRTDILDISEKRVVLQRKYFRFQCTYKSWFIFPNSEFCIQFKIDVERYWKKESSFLFLIKHYTSLCFILKRLFILPTLMKCFKKIFNIDHIRIYNYWEWVTRFTIVKPWIILWIII